MTGKVIIGGGFFTHEKMSFNKLLCRDKEFTIKVLDRSDIVKPRMKITEDYVILFGMKGIERMLRKMRCPPKKIWSAIQKFLSTIPSKIPLIVVDDYSLKMSSTYSAKSMSYLFDNFNIKLYLLREYLKTKTYPSKVISFNLPADDYTSMAVDSHKKGLDVFFQGNLSSDDRSKTLQKIAKHTRKFRCHYKPMTGGVKNTKDRLPFKKFLKKLASAHCCLHFAGSGYDCYRYHEIASVGSIIVSPDYDIAMRYDYVDMHSCIKYKSVKDLKDKLNRVLESEQLLANLQKNSMNNFRQFHTCKARHAELKDLIYRAVQ